MTVYRTASASVLLRPWQIRERRFARTGWRRRGADPQEVSAFLDRVADDLTTLYAALASAAEENARVKAALREWQSWHARTCHGDPQRMEYAR